MSGCFRRLLSLILLVLIAVGLYVARDRWLPRARELAGFPAGRSAAADSSAAAADTGWMSLSFAAGERGRQAVSRLRSGKGPSLVRLNASEFASAALDSLMTQLPASTDSLQVRTSGSEFQVRARVRLADLGGRGALGPLAAMLGDRERLLLGGMLEPTATPGLAQFRLTRVRVGDFTVPGAVVPRLVQSIKRQGGTTPAGVDASALPVRLPAGVGDIRTAQGRITIYRAAP
ncbi:MAG: hypothetical protein V4813_06690 [Gemmatimonadota bacterium]